MDQGVGEEDEHRSQGHQGRSDAGVGITDRHQGSDGHEQLPEAGADDQVAVEKAEVAVQDSATISDKISPRCVIGRKSIKNFKNVSSGHTVLAIFSYLVGS